MLVKLLREVVLHPRSAVATFQCLRAYRRAQELLRAAEVQGSLAAAQLRLACEHSGRPEQVMVECVARWMEREPLPLLEGLVHPSLPRFLTEAQGRGIRLGVLSDYPASAKLDAMRLTGFFDVVISAQDPAVNRFKPHPSGLSEILRRLGTRPSDSLYVGDRDDVDATAAHAAGMPCVIVGKRSNRTESDWIPAYDYADLRRKLFSPPGAVALATPGPVA